MLSFLTGFAFGRDVQENDDALSARSSVDGLAFVMRSDLPHAPASARTQKDCDWKLSKPTTRGGKLTVSLGWGVTAEKLLGAYEAVSFAGQFEPGTSGSCGIDKGNVAIFKSGQLLALAYAAKGSKQTIGSVSQLQDGLRIWSGDLEPEPIGDLSFLDGYLFQIAPVAAEDVVCSGKGSVPNIYDKPINQARGSLIAKGWMPLKNPHDLASDTAQFGRELALSQRGVIEVDSCSGTGFAYCAYFYRQGDMELGVTSVGDDDFPAVTDYAVTCDEAHWHKPD